MSKIKLAAIGDSLTQGFRSGAISEPEWSFPAIVARSLGLAVPTDFRVPSFGAHGLPLNLEQLLYRVQFRLSSRPSAFELGLRLPLVLQEYLDEVEDYFERGRGSRPRFGGLYHNLAVWGFALAEATRLRVEDCDAAIRESEGFIEDDFLGLPSGAMYRTARMVLNPSGARERRQDTQLCALDRLVRAEGPLDALIVWLGTNDALGTVLEMEIRDMAEVERPPKDPVELLRWNLTSEPEFSRDYQRLASDLDEILRDSPGTRVFVGNVPHVTIPPITRGQGEMRGGYFDHYTRFFVPEGTPGFALERLTRQDAVLVDRRIDAFNRVVSRAVEDRENWFLVDTCALLDSLAVRRYGHDAEPDVPLREHYARRDAPEHPLLALDPVPSVQAYRLDSRGRRVGGGLTSLDGVHPSVIGQGLVAEHFLEAMRAAGVPGADPRQVPWRVLIQQDALISQPPAWWGPLMEIGERYASFWGALARALA